MVYAPNDSPMSELMSMRIGLDGSCLPTRLRRVLILPSLHRLRRTRAIHRQADPVPERLDLALHLVMPLHEVVEDRLVPLQPGRRDERHPVAARGFVGRLGRAIP